MIAHPDDLQAQMAELRTIVNDLRPAPTLYTVKSLAAELGKSDRAIRRAIEDGELPATRRTGQWVMTAEAVTAWATSGPRPSGGVKQQAQARPGRRGGLAAALGAA